MKKSFVSFFLIFILAFQSFSVGVFASDLAIAPTEEIQSENISKNIGGGEVQPMGIKTWIVRHSIEVIASALRSFSTTTLRNMLLNVTSVSTTNTILNTRFVLANTLDSIASTINVVTSSIRTEIYNKLVGTVGHNIAWALSQLLDLVAL